MTMARDEHWTLDKRIPLAFLLAIVAQIVGFAWYASKLDSRIESLETKHVEHKERLAAVDKDAKERLTAVDREAKDVFGRLVRLEEKQSATLEILHRIERQLSPTRAP